MKRLMFFGSLPLSVAAPVAVVIAVIVFQNSSDQTTIQMPVSASSAASGASSSSAATAAKTVPYKLFGGKTIDIDRNCADSHHLGSLKADAVTAAEALPPLKQVLLNRRRDYRVFLDRHPQQQLAPAVYAVYTRLRSRYRLSLKRYNDQIDSFNRDADVYNASLEKCAD